MVVAYNLLEDIEKIEIDIVEKSEEYLEEFKESVTSKKYSEDELINTIAIYIFATANFYVGNYSDSIKYGFKSLKYFEEIENKIFTAKTLELIGRTYMRGAKNEDAIEFTLRANEVFKELGNIDGALMTYGRVAAILAIEEKCDESIKYLDIILKDLDKIVCDNYRIVIYINMSCVYNKLRRYEESLELALKSLDIKKRLRKNKGRPDPRELLIMSSVGEIYLLLENYKLAEEVLLEVTSTADINRDIYIMEDSLKNLSVVYQKTNRLEEAFETYKKYIEYREISAKEALKRQNDEVLAKYENEKEKRESEIYRLKNIELKKQAEKLKKYADRISVINEVGRIIASEEDINKSFDLFYKASERILDVDNMGIAIVSEDSNDLLIEYIIEGKKATENSIGIIVKEKSYINIAYERDEDILYGVEGHTISDELAEIIKDAQIEILTKNDQVKSAIFCILKARGEKLGVLVIENKIENGYSNDDYNILKSLVAYLSIAIDNNRKTKKLNKLSYTDTLTGLKNRRYLDRIESKIAKEREDCTSSFVGVINGDINNLKKINDTCGHAVGDEYIVTVSNILRDTLDEDDFIIRMGGDEFMLVQIGKTLEEITRVIDEINLKCELDTSLKFTPKVSLGYAYGNNLDKGFDFLKLYEEAETMMYSIKSKYYKDNNLDRRR